MTTSPTSCPSLEIQAAAGKIRGVFLFLLFTFLSAAGLVTVSVVMGSILFALLFGGVMAWAIAVVAIQLGSVARCGRAPLTLEPEGLRIGFASAFFPYGKIAHVDYSYGSLGRVILSLRPDAVPANYGIPFCLRGLWPGRHLFLLAVYKMPASKLAGEIAQRIEADRGIRVLTN